MPVSDYYDSLLSLCGYYRENKQLVLPMLKKFDSPVTILNSVYQFLVNRKEIKPIQEGLTTDQLQELWNESVIKETKFKRLAYVRAKYLLQII